MKNENKYPIKAVSQLTGLSQFIIRAWEKRYQALDPERTDSNRRLYSERDIEKLRLLDQAIKKGHNIGGIANLSIADLKDLIGTRINETPSSLGNRTPIDKNDYSFYLDSSFNAIKNFNSKAFESILIKASVNLPQPILIDKIVSPLIERIGEMWQTGELRVAHEHLASAILRTFLSNIVEGHNIPETAPNIVIGTPLGQNHELGALMVSVVAASEGWKVTYLGANLPAEEIAAAVDQTNAKVLAMSIVYPYDDVLLRKEILRLKMMLETKVNIITGGSGVEGYLDILEEMGVDVIVDFQNFKNTLNKIRMNKYN